MTMTTKTLVLRYVGQRKRAAPAPGLHPPGFGGSRPEQNLPRLQARDEAERQHLRQVTRLQVRGEAVGLPNAMRSDWDRMKLEEAMWLNERADKPHVDVVKLGRSRAMRAQFNGNAQVPSAAAKSAERPHVLGGELSQQGQRRISPAEQAPSSSRTAALSEDAVQESAFVKQLRTRADELAMRGQEREREQDRD